jgi:hypothetical protein
MQHPTQPVTQLAQSVQQVSQPHPSPQQFQTPSPQINQMFQPPSSPQVSLQVSSQISQQHPASSSSWSHELHKVLPDGNALRLCIRHFEETQAAKLAKTQKDEAIAILSKFAQSYNKMCYIPVHNFAQHELDEFTEVLRLKGFEVLVTSVSGLLSLVVSV